MRDVPYILAMIGFIVAFAVLGMIFFFTDSDEDKAVTTLNNLARNSAIHHVDMTSRVDIGHMYLNQDGTAQIVEDPSADPNVDFESAVLTGIAENAPKGSEVRFDYVTRTGSRTIPVSVYTWDGETWSVKTEGNKRNWRPMTARESVEAIRVQYREVGNRANSDTTDLDDPDYWSYQSTIEVDRSDFVEAKMEAATP